MHVLSAKLNTIWLRLVAVLKRQKFYNFVVQLRFTQANFADKQLVESVTFKIVLVSADSCLLARPNRTQFKFGT